MKAYQNVRVVGSWHADASGFFIDFVEMHSLSTNYATFSLAVLLSQESPLPLTDPRDAEARRMLNIPHRIVW